LLAPKTATGPKGISIRRRSGFGIGFLSGSGVSIRASTQDPSRIRPARQTAGLDSPFPRKLESVEKQNSLQMSRVFFGIAHSSFARFAFQGFYMRDHGTRQRYRLSSRPVNAHANQEPTRYAENAQAMTRTFNKFWSRCSEAASARQRCSQSDHDTLRSRRSEARPR